jgi:hypothetical protein
MMMMATTATTFYHAGLDFDAAMKLLGEAASPVALTFWRGDVATIPPAEGEVGQLGAAVEAVADADVAASVAAAVPPSDPSRPNLQPRSTKNFDKKLIKTATNSATWKDPIYAGSLAFTVLMPLAIYAASKLSG